MRLRAFCIAFCTLGVIVGVTYGIKWGFPQLTNDDLGNIGGVIFIGFTASLIWFDYGIDWDTYKFKNKSKNKRK
jgi:hypothetical protein